jgi:hypothetical protein
MRKSTGFGGAHNAKHRSTSTRMNSPSTPVACGYPSGGTANCTEIRRESRREGEAGGALEREQRRQDLELQKREDAERARAKKQRERMIAKADAALEKARTRHDYAIASLDGELQ